MKEKGQDAKAGLPGDEKSKNRKKPSGDAGKRMAEQESAAREDAESMEEQESAAGEEAERAAEQESAAGEEAERAAEQESAVGEEAERAAEMEKLVARWERRKRRWERAKRVIAMAGVVLLVSMFLATFIVACLKFEGSDRVFKGLLGCDIVIPGLLGAYLIIYRVVSGQYDKELEAKYGPEVISRQKMEYRTQRTKNLAPENPEEKQG